MKRFESKQCVDPETGELLRDKENRVKLRAGVYRLTRTTLGFNHGPDRDQPLVVGLWEGDLISVRPQGTRREPLSIRAVDLYEYLIRCKANKANLERAREKKAKKAQRLADQRQQRAEKRITRPLE